MFFRNKLLVALSAFALVGGATAGLLATKANAVETKAASTTIYYCGDNYDTPYAYAWQNDDDTNKNATYPGVAMTEVSDNLWSVTIDTDTFDRIIFSDNGDDTDKTSDLTINATQPYYYETEKSFKDKALSTGYYLLGDYISWSFNSATTMEYSSTTSAIIARNVPVTNGQVKAIYVDSTYAVTWINAADRNDFGVAWPTSGDNAWASSGNVGCYIQKSETVYLDIRVALATDNNVYQFDDACDLTAVIGATEVAMKHNIDNFNEYAATFESAVATGATLSFKDSSEASASYKANSDAYNNLSGTAIKVGGTGLVVTYNKYDDNYVWVTGYSNFHDFVLGFLADTVSESVCNNPVTTAKDETNVWAYYYTWHNGFNEYEKTLFQNAVTAIDGDPTTYSGEIQEVAARYVWLLQKYGSLAENNTYAFSGVVLPAGVVAGLSPLSTDTGNAVLAAMVASGVVLVSVGGFFFLRKRKQF